MTEHSAPWWMRALFVGAVLPAWYWTQALLGRRPLSAHGIGDRIHALTEPSNRYLNEHPRVANGVLIGSSALIDLLAVFLLGRAICGPTIRPFLSLILVFALRQVCQWTTALPPPEGMIWRHPGFPSLVVTYGVGNDLFFSGHTAIAVLGAVELSLTGHVWLGLLGAGVALLEVSTVLVLRAHYTLDVFTGAVVALLISATAGKLAPACDAVLSALQG